VIVKDGTFGEVGWVKAGPCRQDKRDLSNKKKQNQRRAVDTIQVLEVHGKDTLYAERRLHSGPLDRRDRGGCAA
jgi:hypothetical protein